jgi:hypothetical protein
MRTRLFRCCAAVFLALALALPFAAGQSDITIDRGVKVDAAAESERSGSGPSALPYVAMVIYTMLVLTIVFMPSRKA